MPLSLHIHTINGKPRWKCQFSVVALFFNWGTKRLKILENSLNLRANMQLCSCPRLWDWLHGRNLTKACAGNPFSLQSCAVLWGGVGVWSCGQGRRAQARQELWLCSSSAISSGQTTNPLLLAATAPNADCRKVQWPYWAHIWHAEIFKIHIIIYVILALKFSDMAAQLCSEPRWIFLAVSKVDSSVFQKPE